MCQKKEQLQSQGERRFSKQRKQRKEKGQSSCWSEYLRLHTAVLDLTGVQTLLLWTLHAGKHPSTAVAHRVDGTLIMEARPVGDDLEKIPQSEVELI